MSEYQLKGPDAVFSFTVRRNVTNLFKSFLTTLEDITSEHDEALLKLRATLPPEHRHCVDLAAFLTEAKCIRLRKNVLEAGNDTIRSLEEERVKYKIEFR